MQPKLYYTEYRQDDGDVSSDYFVSCATDQKLLHKEAEELWRSEMGFDPDYQFEEGEVICYFNPLETATDFNGKKRYAIELKEINI